MPVRRPILGLAALALLGAPAAAAAQPVEAPAAPRPLVTQTASINLLALPFGFAAGEYERALQRGFALGIGGITTLGFSPVNDDDDFDSNFDQRFTTAQLKLKYYPGENGLRGFAVGVTAGIVYAGESQRGVIGFDPTTGTPIFSAVSRKSTTAPTLGAVLDYNFLLGRRRRFLVGIGVGARRAFGVNEIDPVDAVLPDGRLQIGFGF